MPTERNGYGTHEVARFCHRHRDRLTLVSKLCPDANLFAPPPPYSGNGRPRVKGDRVPKPRQAAETAPRIKLTVVWYGGGTRRVEAASGTGHWYKGGRGLVPVRWVFVKDATGTDRDEYLFTTDVGLSPDAVVGTYCGRWSIETTFQEARSALGPETTRGRCRSTVLRAAPCLFGLYTVVAILFHTLPAAKRVGAVSWPDVACLQELKTPQEKFPADALREAGYHAIWHGQRAWNGVAILARTGEPIETGRGLPGERQQ